MNTQRKYMNEIEADVRAGDQPCLVTVIRAKDEYDHLVEVNMELVDLVKAFANLRCDSLPQLAVESLIIEARAILTKAEKQA